MKLMSWKERLSRPIVVLVCMVLALSVCMTTAFAYERINTDAETSLTVDFGSVEGGAFRLYKVAEVSDAVVFTLTGDFANAPVDMDAIESASDWADMAVTLSAWADANGVAAGFTGTTDENGTVSFSGLTVGLYLLVGDTAVVGDYAYTPAPAIIMLPTLLEDDTWEYAPSVDVKYTSTFLTEYQNITVKKVWKDGDYENRPDSVKIQLLRDGEVYDTVTLDADNNWTYTWSDLTATYEGEDGTQTYTYAVNEESVPADYTVLVSQNGDTFTVTNCREVEPDPTPSDDTPTGDKLPQTGTLNWPIPVLTIFGLLLVGLGWYLFSRKKEN